MTIIGGADGPTAVFIAGKTSGISWLNVSEETWKCQLTLAILPTLLFLLCGITMKHYLLVVFGILFGIEHIYVTAKNRED